jgi:hypothetical protein
LANADAVIAGRNFLVYSKAHDVANAIPADTVDYGDAWTDWDDRGYTSGGLGLTMNVQRGEIRVDQEFDPITRPVNTRTVQLRTSLSEMTPDNLQLASGLGSLPAPVAPGVGTRGHQDLVIDSTVVDEYNSWGYDILQPDGEAFRIVIYKGLATGSPAPQFSPETQALIELQVDALVDTSTTPSRVALIRDVLPAT